jgi:hypothetical protein
MRFAFLILAVSLAGSAGAGEVTLQALQDAYICDCQPDVTNPNGGPTHLYHGRYGSCYDRTLIEWDLSDLPPSAVIEHAEMRLYCMSFTGTPSGQPVYYMINDDWSELTVTLNTQPSWDDIPSLTASWPAPSTWFALDVTQFVQAWVDGSHENHGIYCTSMGATGTSVPGFWSSDAAQEDLHPVLVVTYSLAALDEGTWCEVKTLGD